MTSRDVGAQDPSAGDGEEERLGPYGHLGAPASGRAGAEALMEGESAPSDAPSHMIGRLHQLCAASVRHLPARGASVSVVTTGGGVPHDWGTIAAAGPSSGELDELQFTLGEGPCWEALTSRRPVLEADLAGRGLRRWPAYGSAANALGVQAVFAFPLQVGAAGLGALEIYRDEPGPLTSQAYGLAATFAGVALELLLDGQADAGEGEPPAGLGEALSYRMEVYQAQGMLMVDLGVDATTAILRLRAQAFSSGRPMADVARDIVTNRLRLDPD